MSRQIISRRRAAEQLGISLSTIIRIEQEGRLKPIRLRPGGTVFYAVEQIDALIADAGA